MSNEGLFAVAQDNLDFFRAIERSCYNDFVQIFESIVNNLGVIDKIANEVKTFAPEFDFDESSPGNGYRTFLYFYEKCLHRLLKICSKVQAKRQSIFFSKCVVAGELAAYAGVLKNLTLMGAQLVIAQSKSKHSNLFSIENSIPETIDSVNLQAFFGRATSFQYPNSCQKLLKPLAAFQSAYFEYFCSNNCTISKAARFTSSLISNLTHPEKLAEKSAKQLKSTNVAYAKKHMNAIDMLMRLQLFPSSCFRTKIYRKILVPLNLDSNCESETKITFMTCRLYTPRSTRAETPSGLIFHVQGGGWFHQNPEFYKHSLTKWATELNIPILSVHYSIGPESPFPQSILEVFNVYLWVLKNFDQVGSTGENIVFVGDSAGANLLATCIIKCIETGVRKPDGFCSIYGFFLLKLMMSPSRLMSITDFQASYVMLVASVESYSSKFPNFLESSDINQSSIEMPAEQNDSATEEFPKYHHLSPLEASKDIFSQFPTTICVSSTIDLLLDDSVEIAKRLKSAGTKVKLEVIEGLGHGFLFFAQFSPECHEALGKCTQLISDLLKGK